MMFDLRKFWLGTAIYVSVIGVVTAALGAAFYVLIGVSAPPTARVQTSGDKGIPVESSRDVAAPRAVTRPSLVHQTPVIDTATTMPQLVAPKPIIVEERASSQRSRSSR